MVNYEKLGYKNFDEYLEDFNNSLLVTIHNYKYFVNWEKIYKNVEKNVVPINILNSLNKIPANKIYEEFNEILNQYPEVVPILPSILAIRYERKKDNIIDVFEDKHFKSYDFSKENFNKEDIIHFCKESGLLDLFTTISDLYTYLLGTEVGLDTNARKSRSGTLFESIVEDMLLEHLKNQPEYFLESQDKVKDINTNKIADFIIYKNGDPKYIIECNYYNSTGSKPSEVARAYMELEEMINDTDMQFIWLIDGQGWKKMQNPLIKSMENIQYLVNYNILDKNLDKFLD
jgi:type II restriction enzyme